VTDPAGAYSEKTMTFQAGSFAPVAVADKSYATVLLGATATASGLMSFDDDSASLTYSWAVDSAPAASSATIAAPASSSLAFTPDVAGTYVVSLTVSDGANTSTAYVTVRALTAFAANVELAFVPLETRYSKGLDKLVMLTTNPNTVRIIDPFTGTVKTVLLPMSGKTLGLSPDGKLAAVLQEGIVSLIDVNLGVLLHSSSADANYSEALVGNSGNVYLMGRVGYSSYINSTVIDGRTGADLTASLGSGSASLYSNYRGVYSPIKNRVFLYTPGSSSYLNYLELNATTGKLGNMGGGIYGSDYFSMIYLSETEDLVFTSSGSYFRADTLQSAGKLAYVGTMQSLSHSAAMDETLVMSSSDPYYTNARTYQASYKRYIGALFVPDTDLMLPIIAGQQSYGIQIYHSAAGKQVALVQTVSAQQNGTGAKYYVLAR
jgi:hypothetical protein